jgi:hypothetical protein
VFIHYAKERNTPMLRCDYNHLLDWLRANRYPQTTIIDILKEKFGAQLRKVILGAGTVYASVMQIAVLEIPLVGALQTTLDALGTDQNTDQNTDDQKSEAAE